MIDLFIQVRIFDIIDIFLVALLFYWFYRILKGTSAISIFLGIVAIFLISGTDEPDLHVRFCDGSSGFKRNIFYCGG